MKNAAGDLPRRVVFYTGSLRERECRVKFYFVIRSVVRTRVPTPSSIQRDRCLQIVPLPSRGHDREVFGALALSKWKKQGRRKRRTSAKVNARASWGAAVLRPYMRDGLGGSFSVYTPGQFVLH